MNSKFNLLFTCLCFVAINLFSQHKTVFIIIDGVPADVVEKTDVPYINEISRTGAYTRAYLGGVKGSYSESPTISAVGYNHLLTGTWSNKHNVLGNGIENPNYNYQNIFRVAENADSSLQTAIFSTWLDNRTKLVGDGVSAAGNIHIDYAFDGFEKDTIRFSHHNPAYIFDIDELVSKEAARYIKEKGPDLSWVYLEYTDDTGHKFGDSPQFTDALKKADIQIGRVWDAVKERMAKVGEEWLIVVTTDHGRSPKDGKDHGGQSDRERTVWISTNYNKLNTHFKQTPATVDIMPSILNFMNIKMPDNVRMENDGVPFIGKVSISDLHAQKTGNNSIKIMWKVLDPQGEAEVLVSTTNNFKTGKADQYISLGKTKVSSGEITVDVSKLNSDFYKILVKAPDNWVNTWVGKG